MNDAICRVICFRMCHKSLGLAIDLTMYCRITRQYSAMTSEQSTTHVLKNVVGDHFVADFFGDFESTIPEFRSLQRHISNSIGSGKRMTYSQGRNSSMESSNSFSVSENWVVLLHSDRFAVLLVNILQTDDRRIVLDESHARSERDRDRNIEREIPLATFLASSERTAVATLLVQSRRLQSEETDQLSMRKSCMILSSRREDREEGI